MDEAPDRDEWRWFAVKNELFVYAESRDHLDLLLKKFDALGTQRFRTGQTRPCIELAVLGIEDDV